VGRRFRAATAFHAKQQSAERLTAASLPPDSGSRLLRRERQQRHPKRNLGGLLGTLALGLAISPQKKYATTGGGVQRHMERASGECRKHAIGGASGDRYQSAETAPFVEKQHCHRPLLLVVQLSSERARQAVRQDCSFAKKQESPPALLVVVQGSHLRRQWRCDCLRGTEIGRACSESDTARERVRCGARRVRKHEATPNGRSAYERITPSPSSTAAASAADAGVVEGRDRGDAVAREGEHHEPAGTRDWTVGVPVSPPRF
jgi:hypothetical protein